jgi:hypothetical protein
MEATFIALMMKGKKTTLIVLSNTIFIMWFINDGTK